MFLTLRRKGRTQERVPDIVQAVLYDSGCDETASAAAGKNKGKTPKGGVWLSLSMGAPHRSRSGRDFKKAREA